MKRIPSLSAAGSFLLSAVILVLAAGTSPLRAQTPRQRSTASSFMDAMVARQWDRLLALQHPTMLQKTKPEQWISLMDTIEAQGGPYRSYTAHGATAQGSDAAFAFRVQFAKDSLEFTVVVDSVSLVEGFWVEAVKTEYAFAPPPYARLESFREEPVRIGDSLSGLSGMLAIPNGPGPFAAVLLLHGSGPQDRDETYLGNKPFRDIAWGLASRGVLVLRYDKRTRAYPGSLRGPDITIEREVLADARAALRLLHGRKDVDASRLSIAGHSLGGIAAPLLAREDSSVRGIALLAAPARPLELVIADQISFLSGKADSAARSGAMARSDTAALRRQLELSRAIEREEAAPTAPFMYLPASYYYDLHRRNHLGAAEGLSIPILVVQGGKDYQVTGADFEIWKRRLERKPSARFHLCDRCYHLMIETDGAPGPETYKADGHVSADLIRVLASWAKRK